MSNIALQGGATGTGTVSLVAPSTSTNRTLTLPDATGTLLTSGGAIAGTTGTFSGAVSGTTGTFSGAVSGTTGTFSGDLSFNSGYGSAAVGYGCRAWVNFNGTGTVAIRASGNVSSITDNGTGDYTVNFTTAMSDANYSVNVTASTGSLSTTIRLDSLLAASVRFRIAAAGSVADADNVCVSIFR